MKIVTASNGKKTVKMSKKEWQSIGKKAGWEKKAQSKSPVSIFELVEDWKDEGYGIALIDTSTGKVVSPYVDPSDYPDLMFYFSGESKSTDGKYRIHFHSGSLEKDPNYFSND
jgi:hypothetical protein